MRITSENSVGVVIDLQERLLPHMDNAENLLERCRIFIQGLKILSLPILFTEQYPQGLGKTVQPVAVEISGEDIIEKRAFSCYDEVNFATCLSESNRKTVLIAGIETHVCVLQTVLDLLENDYLPIVVADCVSSRNGSDREIALRRIEREGGYITSTESLLFEIMKSSHHQRFREISRLVK